MTKKKLTKIQHLEIQVDYLQRAINELRTGYINHLEDFHEL